MEPHAHSELASLTGVLSSLLGSRRGLLHHRIAFALVEGPRFVFDPEATTPFAPGWSRRCDLTILLNASALRAWLEGTLDPKEPLPDEVLLWAGDVEALEALGHTLRRSGTSLQLRAGDRT